MRKEKDVISGKFYPPEWEKFIDTPILLWYPHTPIPHYK